MLQPGLDKSSSPWRVSLHDSHRRQCAQPYTAEAELWWDRPGDEEGGRWRYFRRCIAPTEQKRCDGWKRTSGIGSRVSAKPRVNQSERLTCITPTLTEERRLLSSAQAPMRRSTEYERVACPSRRGDRTRSQAQVDRERSAARIPRTGRRHRVHPTCGPGVELESCRLGSLPALARGRWVRRASGLP